MTSPEIEFKLRLLKSSFVNPVKLGDSHNSLLAKIIESFGKRKAFEPLLKINCPKSISLFELFLITTIGARLVSILIWGSVIEILKLFSFIGTTDHSEAY